MAEAGILTPDDRVELIEGRVIKMSPIGSKHAACVKRLNGILQKTFGPKTVCIQSPVRLNDYSEPEPDVALVRARDDYYESNHPAAADTLLIIEVADPTVLTDRNIKVPLYARSEVAEVWLVNLPSQRVELFWDPQAGTYQQSREFKCGEIITSVTVTNFSVEVNEILG